MQEDIQTKEPVNNFPIQEKVCWDYEPGSMYLHAFAALLSLVFSIFLIIKSISFDVYYIVGFCVFGFSLFFLYVMSAVYHLIPEHAPRGKKWMQRMDHVGIFVLIASTYTPLCLTVLRGALGWTLLGIIWAIAIIGSSLKLSGVRLPAWMPGTIYAVMGWLGIFAILPLYHAIGSGGILWLIIGGLLYTTGIIFFALGEFRPKPRWFGMHEVFHIFVMAGSAAHVYMLWRYVLMQ